MHYAFDFLILLAAKHSSSAAAADPGGKSMSVSWGIVLFFVILGALVTLSPPKRTFEVKRPKE